MFLVVIHKYVTNYGWVGIEFAGVFDFSNPDEREELDRLAGLDSPWIEVEIVPL